MLNSTLKLSTAVTYTAKEFEKTMDMKRYNSHLLPNGVDVKRFRPGTAKHKGIVVGYVGALREWVDLRPMLSAVKRLKDNGMDISALVVGGEEDLQQYRDYARDENMSNIVTFTGNVPYKDVQGYVRKMDICTVPFRKNRVTDGTNPLKLLEYLAAEKPVVCSDLNEPRNMLGDKILYASNPLEWEMQIEVLAKDAKLRAKLGKAGRKAVLSDYDWANICKMMERILLGQTERRRAYF
jgi:glycosyltransferase involved in cell wall biosynthesis